MSVSYFSLSRPTVMCFKYPSRHKHGSGGGHFVGGLGLRSTSRKDKLNRPMPYPISINKQVTFALDENSIINELTKGLNKIGAKAEVNENKVKMTWCTEFSSQTTSLKELNRGRIILDSTKGGTKVHFRIVLIEHLVIFIFLLAIGLYGLFDSGLDSVKIKIATILLTANFVFCYLFPLMSLNSFIQDINKRTQDNRRDNKTANNSVHVP
jgi:hypothetical protein